MEKFGDELKQCFSLEPSVKTSYKENWSGQIAAVHLKDVTF
jgi:hypothetical protein